MNEPAAWYYVGSFGQLGPLTLEQMEELIDGGVIEKSTFVWKPTMTDWLPAGKVNELASSFKLIEPYSSPPPVPGTTPPVAHHPQQPHAPSAFQSPPRPQYTSVQPYGYSRTLQLPVSDKNRTASGVLQILFPGVGRIYLGYAALGVIQLVLTIATCGLGSIWSIVDGILILSGKVRIDGYGRALED